MFTNRVDVDVEFTLGDQSVSIEADFGTNDRGICFDAEIGTVVYGSVDDYNGTYEVIPKPDDQILQTMNKRMTEDVTIKRVPSHIVPNGFGETFTIGD